MSPETETALPPTKEIPAWFEGPGRTDPELSTILRRSLPERESPTSTEDPAKEESSRYESAASSTIEEKPVAEIGGLLEALFEAAKEIPFEDGIETEFSRELLRLVRKYGNAAMPVLTHLIVHEKVSAEVSAEALRWLGRMTDPETYPARLWLLERSLNSSSAMVRDGAVLGLASLDDPNAILYLELAIGSERCEELRKDMEQVLDQFRNDR